MKLYTEEQVIKMIEKSRETGLTAEYFILTTTPIELPSDEEIEKSSLIWFMNANKREIIWFMNANKREIIWFMNANKREIIFDLGWIKIFEAGAKMVINKIQGGNK